jgi:hypothetical protein
MLLLGCTQMPVAIESGEAGQSRHRRCRRSLAFPTQAVENAANAVLQRPPPATQRVIVIRPRWSRA